MRLLSVFLVTFLAFGQDALVQNLEFPPLARQAQVDGKVVVRLDENGFEVLAGHFLLAPTALSSLGTLWALGAVSDKTLAVYDFVMERPDTRQTLVVQKRSNAVGRVFLRILNRATSRLVIEHECVNPVREQKRNSLAFKSGILRVTVHYQAMCLVAEPSLLLAGK